MSGQGERAHEHSRTTARYTGQGPLAQAPEGFGAKRRARFDWTSCEKECSPWKRLSTARWFFPVPWSQHLLKRADAKSQRADGRDRWR